MRKVGTKIVTNDLHDTAFVGKFARDEIFYRRSARARLSAKDNSSRALDRLRGPEKVRRDPRVIDML